MEIKLIGEQIAKFRKAAGLTQEELGKAVGVSTQAVSRWERGGAPDVGLLPAVADRLGVTIDALFGREGGTPENFHAQARRWICSLPQEQRMDQLCRLIWSVATLLTNHTFSSLDFGYLDRCEMDGANGEKRLVLSSVSLEDGAVFGVSGEDMSFMSVWPEPKEGWAAFLADNETYRRLFECLARPGCMEILRFMHARTWRYYTPGVIAREAGLPAEETAENMRTMAGRGLLTRLELELEEGQAEAYMVHNVPSVVPFLYLARSMAQPGEAYYLRWVEDERPVLRKREEGEGNADESER